MSGSADNILSLLEPFGIGSDEGEIYCFLAQFGQASALEISRKLQLPRTRVYRLLDKLLEKKLVSMILSDRGSDYAANSYKDLEIILAEKETEVVKLKSILPLVSAKLGTIWAQQEHKSQVKYYSGAEGLEQVSWNSLNAKGLLKTMEVGQDMTAFVRPEIAEQMREEFVQRNIFIKQLTNKKHIEPYTKVEGLTKLWEIRYLDPKKIPLNFEFLIYDNVVAMYNFSKKDEFCVEIYNQDLANMMSNIFDFLWSSAQKMKILNSSGEAKI